MRSPILLCTVLTAIAPALVSAAAVDPLQSWLHWRGPMVNGFAPNADPPVEWSETKNVKWKVRIPGNGSSTPIVVGDKIYLLTAVSAAGAPAAKAPEPAAQPKAGGEGQKGGPPGAPGKRGGFGGGFGSEKPTQVHRFQILCLDRKTGSTLWEKTLNELLPHEGHHRDHGFASASPVTDGRHMIVSFGSRGLYGLDMEGNVKWSHDFGDMRTRNAFGEGSSPALHGKTVVLTWDHEGEDFIVALDKETGKQLWRNPRDEITAWTTPFVVEHDGKAQVIASATGAVRSYDLANGQLIWECKGQTVNAIPTPVTAHGMLIAMSGYTGSNAQAIRLGRTGDLTGTDAVVWTHKKSTPYVPSPLLYGDNLYFLASNNATLTCLDVKTGKPHFDAERLEGLRGVYASPVGAAGRVYVVSREGVTAVLRNSTKLELFATNKLDEGIDASPALVGKEIFLRGRQHLYCIATN